MINWYNLAVEKEEEIIAALDETWWETVIYDINPESDSCYQHVILSCDGKVNVIENMISRQYMDWDDSREINRIVVKTFYNGNIWRYITSWPDVIERWLVENNLDDQYCEEYGHYSPINLREFNPELYWELYKELAEIVYQEENISDYLQNIYDDFISELKMLETAEVIDKYADEETDEESYEKYYEECDEESCEESYEEYYEEYDEECDEE